MFVFMLFTGAESQHTAALIKRNLWNCFDGKCDAWLQCEWLKPRDPTMSHNGVGEEMETRTDAEESMKSKAADEVDTDEEISNVLCEVMDKEDGVERDDEENAGVEDEKDAVHKPDEMNGENHENEEEDDQEESIGTLHTMKEDGVEQEEEEEEEEEQVGNTVQILDEMKAANEEVLETNGEKEEEGREEVDHNGQIPGETKEESDKNESVNDDESEENTSISDEVTEEMFDPAQIPDEAKETTEEVKEEHDRKEELCEGRRMSNTLILKMDPDAKEEVEEQHEGGATTRVYPRPPTPVIIHTNEEVPEGCPPTTVEIQVLEVLCML